MTAEKLQTDCDLSETSLGDAASRLRCFPSQLTVYAPRSLCLMARKLQGEIGFQLILVEEVILIKRSAWAVEYVGNVVWSPGCD